MARVQLKWDPFDTDDPGPCIKVMVTNTEETILAGREIGLDYPEATEITALIDTGSPFTIVNRVYAKTQKLFLTNPKTQVRTLGGRHFCGEHSGAIAFPGSPLKRIPTMRILSADFERERFYSCLIGRDILRNWRICFDGERKVITIDDQQ